MSRIGQKLINIPEGVDIKISPGEVRVKGPRGELAEKIHPHVEVSQKEGQISITVKNPQDHQQKALWGLTRALVANMIQGVTEGYEKKLEFQGVGYRVAVQGKKLVLNLGFSHPIEFDFPEGIEIKVEKNVIIISGIGKQLVGETAARIRTIRKPEPYKGKGIKYADEVIHRKAGKVAKGTEGS